MKILLGLIALGISLYYVIIPWSRSKRFPKGSQDYHFLRAIVGNAMILGIYVPLWAFTGFDIRSTQTTMHMLIIQIFLTLPLFIITSFSLYHAVQGIRRQLKHLP